MDNFCDNGLVSIIMLSHGDSAHIVETVKSILAQTYQNSCVPMVLGQAKRQGRAASAASVDRGYSVMPKPNIRTIPTYLNAQCCRRKFEG